MTIQPAGWLPAVDRLWSRFHSSTEAAELLILTAAADLSELSRALDLDEVAQRREMRRLRDRLRATVDRVAS